MLAPQSLTHIENILQLVPPHLITSWEHEALNQELLQEIDTDYENSVRKSIGMLFFMLGLGKPSLHSQLK